FFWALELCASVSLCLKFIEHLLTYIFLQPVLHSGATAVAKASDFRGKVLPLRWQNCVTPDLMMASKCCFCLVVLEGFRIFAAK
ncbi:MAG: hypothetical protein IJT97_08655, partial [Bacteroidaceae bacterium]|nr:hypothetical protein [Bacteroidaceae bacterium]